ncbi:hypothetical protein QFZ86_004604 [Pseudomonas plecoglossicida]
MGNAIAINIKDLLEDYIVKSQLHFLRGSKLTSNGMGH